MFAGSWLFEGLEVVRYVRDATPVLPPETIVEFGGVDGDTIRRLLGRLRLVISLASVIAWSRRVGLRVFVHGSALPEPIDDFIKAALAGGADGLITDDFININSDLINVVPINQSIGEKSVNYIMVEPGNFYTSSVKPYGVIVKDAVIERNWVLQVRDRVRVIYGNKEFLVALNMDSLRREAIEELAGLVDGIVIMEIPSITSLGFDNNRALNAFRCVNCYIDFEMEGEIRKCPRCGGKLRPIVKHWDRLVMIEPRVLRLKASDEIKYMRLDSPKVINFQ
ncbi:hypothetical protein Vsou_01920 [Vulcanisaeta souniana JCM 11219]|uniref:Uncharacterized protein n=2 Tax=Vulcanisaeta souniana TaxID=164452 RepID=A0A830EFQ1_9CREN|nr:hypothetical protein Vsou_01920 [Vulcanisaeta souniana JCM 11219]GGI80781.1 hypothetical protein GCM10007112_17010 [Vulcanisaeta souniana JCM 11219]